MRWRGPLVFTLVAIVMLASGVGTLFTTVDPVVQGADAFTRAIRPDQGLGPLYNATACVACHDEPVVGGMGKGTSGTALRIGRLDEGRFDPLEGRGGPVARARSVAELGYACPLMAGIPSEANVTSVRNAPALFGLGLVDTIPDAAIVAEANRQAAEGTVRGLVHRVTDATGVERIGRFGWKAQVARLNEFVGDAFRSELGVTNPLAPEDFVTPPADARCGSTHARPEDDGSLVLAVTAYIASLEAPTGQAERTQPSGAAIFRQIGCNGCHAPTLPGADGNVPLYSDLLLHDVGPTLDDGVVQGEAAGRQWRTTPLWGLRMRGRLLHDARAVNIPAAVMAHGGEAAPHVTRFRALSTPDREALLAFLAEL
jgi:CxxC motif-containing protein (DUF1111 family)